MKDDTLTLQNVQWIAHLARIELTDDELAAMTSQLASIVEYVTQLQQIPTEDVEPLAHALPVINVFREDELTPSLKAEEALSNAPERRKTAKGEHFFAVPAVLE